MTPRDGSTASGNRNGRPRPRAEWISRRQSENSDGNFSQMHYARQGVLTEEMSYVARRENLPAELLLAPDPFLDRIPWDVRPLLKIRRGRAGAEDAVSLTPCFAAIAETGTLMLVSGAETPTTLNFLPDTHIVVVRGDQIVATYEDGWDRLRVRGGLPRAINFITGPSRTGDIEQRIELGAHGPRRLHIVIVDDRWEASNAEYE